MSLIRIAESNDFFVDYDKDRGMYRVSTFNPASGYIDKEYWFDCYEEKEVDNRIDKIIDKLEEFNLRAKIKMTKQGLHFNADNVEYFINLLINWIKEL